MKYINKYNTTTAYNSDLERLSSLPHFLAYDAELSKIVCMKNKPKGFVYRVNAEDVGKAIPICNGNLKNMMSSPVKQNVSDTFEYVHIKNGNEIIEVDLTSDTSNSKILDVNILSAMPIQVNQLQYIFDKAGDYTIEFKVKNTLTSLEGLFCNIPNLYEIYTDIFSDIDPQTILLCFVCPNLKGIYTDMFNNKQNLTTVRYPFVITGEIIGNIFNNCSNLSNVMPGLFASKKIFNQFSIPITNGIINKIEGNILCNCGMSSVKSIMIDTQHFKGDLLGNCQKLTTVETAFYFDTYNDDTSILESFVGNFCPNCPNLTTINGSSHNAKLFNSTLTDFSGTLCQNCNKMTDISYGFFGTSITDISKIVFNENITIFRNCFNNCTKLTNIPANLFAKNTNATNFNSCFWGCTNLSIIPEKLFEKNINATDFGHCFFNCINISSMPSNLFSTNINATDFSYCFNFNKINTIPENLFKTNTKASKFIACFQNCTELTVIPENLFEKNINATNFEKCFSGCTKLTVIPENLFEKNINATNFEKCFNGCIGLTSIPNNLFSTNTNASNFTGCFSGCTGLTSIPENLFSTNKKIKFVDECFKNCINLTVIPENIFNSNTLISNFDNCFSGCTGLTSIPENLFSTNVEASWFDDCFNGCTGLTSIPSNLFANNKKLKYISNCFYNCTELSGTTPKDTAGELWERAGKEGYANSIDGTDCFYNCTKLSNYNSIPSNWK